MDMYNIEEVTEYISTIKEMFNIGKPINDGYCKAKDFFEGLPRISLYENGRVDAVIRKVECNTIKIGYFNEWYGLMFILYIDITDIKNPKLIKVNDGDQSVSILRCENSSNCIIIHQKRNNSISVCFLDLNFDIFESFVYDENIIRIPKENFYDKFIHTISNEQYKRFLKSVIYDSDPFKYKDSITNELDTNNVLLTETNKINYNGYDFIIHNSTNEVVINNVVLIENNGVGYKGHDFVSINNNKNNNKNHIYLPTILETKRINDNAFFIKGEMGLPDAGIFIYIYNDDPNYLTSFEMELTL